MGGMGGGGRIRYEGLTFDLPSQSWVDGEFELDMDRNVVGAGTKALTAKIPTHIKR